MLLLEDGARRREEHRQEQQAAAVGLREELALLACHFASVHHVVVATRARTLRSDPAAMAATDGGALLEACPDPLASLPPDVVELLATLGGAGVLARLACVSRAGRALAARGGAWEAALLSECDGSVCTVREVRLALDERPADSDARSDEGPKGEGVAPDEACEALAMLSGPCREALLALPALACIAGDRGCCKYAADDHRGCCHAAKRAVERAASSWRAQGVLAASSPFMNAGAVNWSGRGDIKRRRALVLEAVMWLSYELWLMLRSAMLYGHKDRLWLVKSCQDLAKSQLLRAWAAPVREGACAAAAENGSGTDARDAGGVDEGVCASFLRATVELAAEYDHWRGGFYAYFEACWRTSALEQLLKVFQEEHHLSTPERWLYGQLEEVKEAMRSAMEEGAYTDFAHNDTVIPRSHFWWFFEIDVEGC